MGTQPSAYNETLKVGGALISAVAKTTSFNSDPFYNVNNCGYFVTLVATAASGTTPTLSGKLQWSPDAGTTWLDLDTANAVTTNLTAAGNATFVVYPGIVVAAAAASNKPLPHVLRLAFTIGGTTPSFTFNAYASGVV